MATTDVTEQSLIDFRREVFKDMGFSDLQAGVLAACRDDHGWLVDSHKVRKAILAGCTYETAMRIFL